MESKEEEKQRLLRAKKKVRQLKIFYIHLAGYLIAAGLILYNLYIVAGPYKNNIISLNLSILVVWTVLLILHAWRTYKEKKVFKESWENQKIKRFLGENDEETKMWE